MTYFFISITYCTSLRGSNNNEIYYMVVTLILGGRSVLGYGWAACGCGWFLAVEKGRLSAALTLKVNGLGTHI
jgi:hypothetical protein